jgi:hypothetical protein
MAERHEMPPASVVFTTPTGRISGCDTILNLIGLRHHDGHDLLLHQIPRGISSLFMIDWVMTSPLHSYIDKSGFLGLLVLQRLTAFPLGREGSRLEAREEHIDW